MIYLLKMRITRVVPMSAALKHCSRDFKAIKRGPLPCKRWICGQRADLPPDSKRRYRHGNSYHRYPDCPRVGCTLRSSALAVMAVYCDVSIDWMTPPYWSRTLPAKVHFHQCLRPGQANEEARMLLQTDRWYQSQGFPECPSVIKIIIFASKAKYNDQDSFIRFSHKSTTKVIENNAWIKIFSFIVAWRSY